MHAAPTSQVCNGVIKYCRTWKSRSRINFLFLPVFGGKTYILFNNHVFSCVKYKRSACDTNGVKMHVSPDETGGMRVEKQQQTTGKICYRRVRSRICCLSPHRQRKMWDAIRRTYYYMWLRAQRNGNFSLKHEQEPKIIRLLCLREAITEYLRW